MNKKIMLLLLILISIGAMSHVSAVDDVSIDNSTDTQIIGESNDVEYSAIPNIKNIAKNNKYLFFITLDNKST